MCEYVCEPYGATVNGHNNGPYSRRERVVRCQDCKHSYESDNVGKLYCTYFSQWDYFNDERGICFVEPDGFCAWGKPRGES